MCTLSNMAQRTGEARRALWRLAAGQRGFFGADQAVDSGYSYQAQYHNVRHGNWVRIARGVYRFKE